MASTLQELRKAAGYSSSKDFAEAMGMVPTTYVRYESSPEKIPLKVAWTLADHFGVTIDVIVGREESTHKEKNDGISRAYASLSPKFKDELRDFAEFLSAKSKVEAKKELEDTKRNDEIHCLQLEKRFLFKRQMENQEDDLAAFEDIGALRPQFEEYVRQRAAEKKDALVGDAPERIMRAFDRLHSPRVEYHWISLDERKE